MAAKISLYVGCNFNFIAERAMPSSLVEMPLGGLYGLPISGLCLGAAIAGFHRYSGFASHITTRRGFDASRVYPESSALLK